MILEKKISSYKTRMILTINNLNQQDTGSYVCVSGKEKLTSGRWTLKETAFICQKLETTKTKDFSHFQEIYWVAQTVRLRFMVSVLSWKIDLHSIG